MNTTPRLLNRFVLAVVGLIALALGAGGLALLTLPAAAGWWRSAAPRAGQAVEDLRSRTTLEGQEDTWLWIALALVLVFLIVMLIVWIAAQGRGRTGLFATGTVTGRGGGGATGRGDSSGGGTAGSVTITAAAAEQALKAALLERPDLVGASVSTWRIRGVPGIRVRVLPRKGVPPYDIAVEVSRLVEALDAVTGSRTPVLISVSSGARARFTRADRVT
ncbi:hypothetical protein [Arthrobacter ruber]|uniref:hypothetical protein n=1 Tax=Arthrobacter ruber TaxID=1258893 RepID=UPI000CF49C8C|nr:hypothetical protein [Arthrobacter ruber]